MKAKTASSTLVTIIDDYQSILINQKKCKKTAVTDMNFFRGIRRFSSAETNYEIVTV